MRAVTTMHDQRHVILRQTLELTIARSGEAWALQQQVSGLMRKLEAALERCFDELNSSDRLLRIDCLELDLGCLDSCRLEDDLIEKFAQVLRSGLAEHVRQQESAAVSPKIASQLELFARFVRQGALPWWADLTRTDQLRESLGFLLHESPDLLRRLLPELLDDHHAVRRLSVSFDDRQLAELAVLLAPALADFPQQLCQALLNAFPVQSKSRIWQAILSCFGLSEPCPSNRLDFSREVLMRLARLQAVPYSILIRDFVQGAATDLYEDRKEIVTLLAAESGLMSGTELITPKEDKTDVALLYPQWNGRRGEDALVSLHLWMTQDSSEVLPSWLQAWPGALRAALFTRLKELGENLQPALTELRGWLERGTESSMPVWLQTWPMLLREEFTAQLRELNKHLETSSVMPKIRHERLSSEVVPVAQEYHWERILEQSKFSASDTLYLNNAGLVILWPFLKTFFGRQGLLEENRFRDEAARQRGMALLQCLASGDVNVPEYLLALNKLLCGMALEAVFELELPLTEDEIAAGEALLEAVIAQAPILNNMSLSGFRGSFLLRAGTLQVRDGAWLLRVERETYDLVLDRFPWGLSWVKLPWMEAPLQVEW